MQKHRYAFPTLIVLLVTAIMVVAVTSPVATRLLAQASRIGSEPVSPDTEPEAVDVHVLTGPSGSSLAANADYVFVLRRDTLYQFSVRDLQLVRKVSLEEAERPKRK